MEHGGNNLHFIPMEFPYSTSHHQLVDVRHDSYDSYDSYGSCDSCDSHFVKTSDFIFKDEVDYYLLRVQPFVVLIKLENAFPKKSIDVLYTLGKINLTEVHSHTPLSYTPQSNSIPSLSKSTHLICEHYSPSFEFRQLRFNSRSGANCGRKSTAIRKDIRENKKCDSFCQETKLVRTIRRKRNSALEIPSSVQKQKDLKLHCKETSVYFGQSKLSFVCGNSLLNGDTVSKGASHLNTKCNLLFTRPTDNLSTKTTMLKGSSVFANLELSGDQSFSLNSTPSNFSTIDFCAISSDLCVTDVNKNDGGRSENVHTYSYNYRNQNCESYPKYNNSQMSIRDNLVQNPKGDGSTKISKQASNDDFHFGINTDVDFAKKAKASSKIDSNDGNRMASNPCHPFSRSSIQAPSCSKRIRTTSSASKKRTFDTQSSSSYNHSPRSKFVPKCGEEASTSLINKEREKEVEIIEREIPKIKIVCNRRASNDYSLSLSNQEWSICSVSPKPKKIPKLEVPSDDEMERKCPNTAGEEPLKIELRGSTEQDNPAKARKDLNESKYLFSRKIETIANIVRNKTEEESEDSFSDSLPDLDSEEVSNKPECKKSKSVISPQTTPSEPEAMIEERVFQGSSLDLAGDLTAAEKGMCDGFSFEAWYKPAASFRVSSRKGRGFYDETIPFFDEISVNNDLLYGTKKRMNSGTMKSSDELPIIKETVDSSSDLKPDLRKPSDKYDLHLPNLSRLNEKDRHVVTLREASSDSESYANSQDSFTSELALKDQDSSESELSPKDQQTSLKSEMFSKSEVYDDTVISKFAVQKASHTEESVECAKKDRREQEEEVFPKMSSVDHSSFFRKSTKNRSRSLSVDSAFSSFKVTLNCSFMLPMKRSVSVCYFPFDKKIKEFPMDSPFNVQGSKSSFYVKTRAGEPPQRDRLSTASEGNGTDNVMSDSPKKSAQDSVIICKRSYERGSVKDTSLEAPSEQLPTFLPPIELKGPEMTILSPDRANLSPKRTTLSPNRTTMSLDWETLSSDRPTLCSERTTLSSDRPNLSPERTTLSPNRPTLSPNRPTLSLDWGSLTSDGPTLSPERTALSPERTTLSSDEQRTRDGVVSSTFRICPGKPQTCGDPKQHTGEDAKGKPAPDNVDKRTIRKINKKSRKAGMENDEEKCQSKLEKVAKKMKIWREKRQAGQKRYNLANRRNGCATSANVIGDLRIAREIPRFNWLEAKIRTSSNVMQGSGSTQVVQAPVEWNASKITLVVPGNKTRVSPPVSTQPLRNSSPEKEKVLMPLVKDGESASSDVPYMPPKQFTSDQMSSVTRPRTCEVQDSKRQDNEDNKICLTESPNKVWSKVQGPSASPLPVTKHLPHIRVAATPMIPTSKALPKTILSSVLRPSAIATPSCLLPKETATDSRHPLEDLPRQSESSLGGAPSSAIQRVSSERNEQFSYPLLSLVDDVFGMGHEGEGPVNASRVSQLSDAAVTEKKSAVSSGEQMIKENKTTLDVEMLLGDNEQKNYLINSSPTTLAQNPLKNANQCAEKLDQTLPKLLEPLNLDQKNEDGKVDSETRPLLTDPSTKEVLISNEPCLDQPLVTPSDASEATGERNTEVTEIETPKFSFFRSAFQIKLFSSVNTTTRTAITKTSNSGTENRMGTVSSVPQDNALPRGFINQCQGVPNNDLELIVDDTLRGNESSGSQDSLSSPRLKIDDAKISTSLDDIGEITMKCSPISKSLVPGKSPIGKSLVPEKSIARSAPVKPHISKSLVPKKSITRSAPGKLHISKSLVHDKLISKSLVPKKSITGSLATGKSPISKSLIPEKSKNKSLAPQRSSIIIAGKSPVAEKSLISDLSIDKSLICEKSPITKSPIREKSPIIESAVLEKASITKSIYLKKSPINKSLVPLKSPTDKSHSSEKSPIKKILDFEKSSVTKSRILEKSPDKKFPVDESVKRISVLEKSPRNEYPVPEKSPNEKPPFISDLSIDKSLISEKSPITEPPALEKSPAADMPPIAESCSIGNEVSAPQGPPIDKSHVLEKSPIDMFNNENFDCGLRTELASLLSFLHAEITQTKEEMKAIKQMISRGFCNKTDHASPSHSSATVVAIHATNEAPTTDSLCDPKSKLKTVIEESAGKNVCQTNSSISNDQEPPTKRMKSGGNDDVDLQLMDQDGNEKIFATENNVLLSQTCPSNTSVPSTVINRRRRNSVEVEPIGHDCCQSAPLPIGAFTLDTSPKTVSSSDETSPLTTLNQCNLMISDIETLEASKELGQPEGPSHSKVSDEASEFSLLEVLNSLHSEVSGGEASQSIVSEVVLDSSQSVSGGEALEFSHKTSETSRSKVSSEGSETSHSKVTKEAFDCSHSKVSGQASDSVSDSKVSAEVSDYSRSKDFSDELNSFPAVTKFSDTCRVPDFIPFTTRGSILHSTLRSLNSPTSLIKAPVLAVSKPSSSVTANETRKNILTGGIIQRKEETVKSTSTFMNASTLPVVFQPTIIIPDLPRSREGNILEEHDSSRSLSQEEAPSPNHASASLDMPTIITAAGTSISAEIIKNKKEAVSSSSMYSGNKEGLNTPNKTTRIEENQTPLVDTVERDPSTAYTKRDAISKNQEKVQETDQQSSQHSVPHSSPLVQKSSTACHMPIPQPEKNAQKKTKNQSKFSDKASSFINAKQCDLMRVFGPPYNLNEKQQRYPGQFCNIIPPSHMANMKPKSSMGLQSNYNLSNSRMTFPGTHNAYRNYMTDHLGGGSIVPSYNPMPPTEKVVSCQLGLRPTLHLATQSSHHHNTRTQQPPIPQHAGTQPSHLQGLHLGVRHQRTQPAQHIMTQPTRHLGMQPIHPSQGPQPAHCLVMQNAQQLETQTNQRLGTQLSPLQRPQPAHHQVSHQTQRLGIQQKHLEMHAAHQHASQPPQHLNISPSHAQGPQHLNISPSHAQGPQHLNISPSHAQGPQHLNISPSHAQGPQPTHHLKEAAQFQTTLHAHQPNCTDQLLPPPSHLPQSPPECARKNWLNISSAPSQFCQNQNSYVNARKQCGGVITKNVLPVVTPPAFPVPKICFLCDKLAQFLCSGCKSSWYCSKECQRMHWKTHSNTCSGRK